VKLLISSRFAFDSKSQEIMNPIQTAARDRVAEKVRKQVYRFESVPCCICSGMSFVTIAEKDRYGLYFSVKLCRFCGLIQTNPRMDHESYAEFYNEEYRLLYGGKTKPSEEFFADQYHRGVEILNFLIAQGISMNRIHSVLEVGCGAGGIVKVFQDFGCAAKGIDLGREYLDFGRSRYGLKLEPVVIQDISDEEQFDLIIYSHVFEHLLRPVEELQKLRRLLRQDGLLVVELPSVKNVHNAYQGDFLLLLQNAHTYHFTLTTLRNLMGIRGFSLFAGNEYVRAVFAKSDQVHQTDSDYIPVLEYLDQIERAFLLRNGFRLFKLEQLDAAAGIFLEMRSRFPHEVEAAKGLAACLFKMGRREEALRIWKEITRTNPATLGRRTDQTTQAALGAWLRLRTKKHGSGHCCGSGL